MQYKTLSELSTLLGQNWQNTDEFQLEHELTTIDGDELITLTVRQNGKVIDQQTCELLNIFINLEEGTSELRKWFNDQWFEYERDDIPQPAEVGRDITLGTKAVISDPCYGLDGRGNIILDNVRPGTWHVEAEHTDIQHWGTRHSALIAWHESVARPEKFEKLDDVIFVDSGQAGIIDYDHFEHIKSDEIADERWYESIHTFGTMRCPMTAHEQRIANALRQRAQDVLDFKTTADTSEMMSHYIQLMELKAHARDTARQYGVDARSLVDGKAEKYHYKIWNDRYSTISGTGLGDGVYPCFVAKDGNEVIGIRIDYLYESEDD